MNVSESLKSVSERLAKLEGKHDALDSKVDDLRVFQGWVMGGLAMIGALIAAIAAGLGKMLEKG